MKHAKNKNKDVYQSKVNKKSIPITICREIDLPIKSVKVKMKYYNHIGDFLDRLFDKHKLDSEMESK